MGKNIKQGTTLASQIAAVSMDRLYDMAMIENMYILFGNLRIYPLIHYDDIQIFSNDTKSLNHINSTMEIFQKIKRQKFGYDKSQLMPIKPLKVEQINAFLNGEPMIKTDKYKYLGDLMNNKNNYYDLTKERCNKAYGTLSSILAIVNHGYNKKQKFDS